MVGGVGYTWAMLLLLLACASPEETASSGDDTGSSGGCVDPVVTILSPADGAQLPVGVVVELEANVESTAQDATSLQILWAVEDDVVGTGPTASWLPDTKGSFLVRVQATDDCGIGEVGVTVDVVAAK